MMNADASGITNLTNNAAEDGLPAWLPARQGWRKLMRKLVALTALAFAAALLASACGERGQPADAPTPTASPAPVQTTSPTPPPAATPPPTPTPAAVATPTPTSKLTSGGPEIETAAGVLLIKEVELTDRYGIQVANPGYQILIVSLEPKDKRDTVNTGQEEAVDRSMKDVYIVGSDGSREVPFSYGWTRVGSSPEMETELSIAFVPQTSAHDFKLYWPGNPPVDLGR